MPPLGIVSYYIEVEKGKNNPTDKNIQSATNDTVILDNGVSDDEICPTNVLFYQPPSSDEINSILSADNQIGVQQN